MFARARAMRLAGERFVLRLNVSDVRVVGFQRAAEAAYALPPSEREAMFVQLRRAEGVKDERGERIRRMQNDILRAREYAAIAILAETCVVPYHMKRLYILTNALDPVESRHIESELIAPDPSATVPDRIVAAAVRDTIVIWCGSDHVRSAALVIHAVADLGLPIVVVANGTIVGAESIARFVPIAEGAAALARARVVVAADSSDPADAIALARLGIPMITASSSGAFEYVPNAPYYRVWIERDIVTALLTALGAPLPRLDAFPRPLGDFDEFATDGARVAVLTRVELGESPDARTATSIAQQTYRAVVRAEQPNDAAYEMTISNGSLLFADALARMLATAERTGAARVVAPALVERSAGIHDVDYDGFALTHRGASGETVVRLAVAVGIHAGD